MPKIMVGYTDRYPDFYISTLPDDPVIEITEEELELIKRADDGYTQAQNILRRAFREA